MFRRLSHFGNVLAALCGHYYNEEKQMNLRHYFIDTIRKYFRELT